ncbi:hypothetical protein [Microterricola viridarii]|uniref:Tfp pilus assembly protein PilN n=1 Tax=Microterricola viridarii TaxID=412690 RepID=A0A1H1PXE6_9MICO|nr:hypothetical protein [Microterricola viridarii]SDS15786.1 hypothetical protein SAMN04489834_0966 [Microterricola viridarii]
MSGQKKGGARADTIEIGGVPRVDLLPPEVRAAAASRVLRRRLGVGLLGVVTVVVLMVTGATAITLGKTIQLIDAQARTDALLAEQTEYVEVRRVQQDLNAVSDARMVGSFTEVQWREYLQAVQASLPAGVAIRTASISAASPLEEFAQATTPLQSPRIATVGLEATSPTLPNVPLWLDGLAGLTGYAGASPDSVTFDDKTGLYTVSIKLQVNGEALSARFVPEAEAAGETPTDDDAEPTGDAAAQGGN